MFPLLFTHSPQVNDIGANELFIKPWEERCVSSFFRRKVEPAHLTSGYSCSLALGAAGYLLAWITVQSLLTLISIVTSIHSIAISGGPFLMRGTPLAGAVFVMSLQGLTSLSTFYKASPL